MVRNRVTAKRIFLGAVIAALMGFLAGCTALAEPEKLDGSKWVLVSLQGAAPLPGTRITLEFKDGTASGYTGCNHYGGGYSVERGNRFKRDIISITVQGCQESIMTQEKAYMDSFFKVAFYRLVEDQLELLDSERNPLLVYARQPTHTADPAALKGTAWKLTTLRGEAPVAGSLIWLAFEDGTYRGFGGCRHFKGTYQADGDELGFPYLEMKEVDCFAPQAVSEQEGIFINMISTTEAFSLIGNRLEIFTLDGSSMVFEPLPPEEMQSEAVVWELQAFTEGDTQTPILPGTQITLTFSASYASGSSGCNTYSANFNFDGSFFAFQPAAATKMACPDPEGIMEQETRFLTTLQDVVFYKIEGNQLSLQTEDGRGLAFTAGGR